VGSSARSGAQSSGDQSTLTPWAWACASELQKRSNPPSPRLSEPIAATVSGSLPVASMVSCRAIVSTGCGLISMKAVDPDSIRARVACSKRTVWRRLRYQYSALSAEVSSNAPVVVE